MKDLFKKFEKTLGNMKSAVVLILIFLIFMIIGTFLESFHGAEYASNAIYKTKFFMGIQFAMFLSILFAWYLRLPAKKRLYGFYTIHSGLILLGVGSFITWYAGIDGAILLEPGINNRTVILNETVLKVEYPEQNKIYSYEISGTVFPQDLNITQGDFSFGKYLPSSDLEKEWISFDTNSPAKKQKQWHTSEYLISNENVAQDFILTRHPEAKEFENSLALGPLSIQYMPAIMANCFKKKTKSGLFFWNSKNNTCYTPEEKKLKLQKLSSGKEFYVLESEQGPLTFFPKISPWPIDKNLQIIRESPLKIFNKGLFQQKPYLVLFGKQVAYFLKDEERWEVQPINDSQQSLDLPWMGFELKLLRHETERYPTLVPKFIKPVQESGQLIKGALKAVKVNVKDEEFWLNTSRPISLLIEGKRVNLYLGKKEYKLPFELVLDRFKMNKDPGTNNPASYESFLKVFSKDGPSKHHVYMNNPLKFWGYTFYQASYSPRENGTYDSTLSVNVDQGRPFKYLGSILLVLGAVWHYNLNIKKKKTNISTGITNA